MPYGFIGDLLVGKGIVDASQLVLAAARQATHGTTLARTLADLGVADESLVASTIAAALHLEYLDGPLPVLDPALVALLTETFAASAASCR